MRLIPRRSTAAGLSMLALLLAPAACKRSSDAEPNEERAEPAASDSKDDDGRWYRAVLSDGDAGADEIPFYLLLPRSGTGAAIVKNGPQRLEAEARWDGSSDIAGSSVTITNEILHTTIRADSDGAVLRGQLQTRSKTWGDASLELVAEPVNEPDPRRLFAAPGSGETAADAGGVWRVEFLDGSGDAKLELEQDGSALTGTIHFQTGNFVLLAGNVFGDRAALSAFDGSSPYLMTLELHGDELDGHWIAGPQLAWREDFDATRGEDFDWKPKIGSGILPATLKLPQLDDPRYDDKAVIVELAGSWCATCQYAAPVMVELYDRLESEGLEILTLLYEFTSDEAYNHRQAEVFKREYGLAWEVVPVHGGLEDYAELMPPGLEAVNAAGFPIAIFLDRDRRIRGIHAGFPSPATEAHGEAVAEYQRLAEQIVKGRAETEN
jgi:thiol-disulfide isomerase/thioredoxin